MECGGVLEAMVEPLRRLILATGNPHKARELAGLLTPLGVPVLSLAELRAVSPVNEDGASVAENAQEGRRVRTANAGMGALR